MPDPHETGERVERLLAELTANADADVAATAEELVRSLMDLYGAGLARIVELAHDKAATELVAAMTSDDLVASLLALHDLHPEDLTDRVLAALDQVRPYLGSHAGGVEFLGVDTDLVVHLRLEGSCDGCPSSAVTVKYAIERAVAEAAPEVAGIHVEGLTDPATTSTTEPHLIPAESLLRSPVHAELGDDGGAGGRAAGGWATVDGLAGLRPGELRPVEVDGAAVVVCQVGDELYAYRNGCPACAQALDGAQVDGGVLACPHCAAGYDVRLAGRGTPDAELHLDPLPLLREDGEIRIAAPAVAQVSR